LHRRPQEPQLPCIERSVTARERAIACNCRRCTTTYARAQPARPRQRAQRGSPSAAGSAHGAAQKPRMSACPPEQEARSQVCVRVCVRACARTSTCALVRKCCFLLFDMHTDVYDTVYTLLRTNSSKVSAAEPQQQKMRRPVLGVEPGIPAWRISA